MSEQLTLADDMRVDPPACYDEVASAMEAGLDNAPEIAGWDAEKLAGDMFEAVGWMNEQPNVEDIAKCILIWREREIANG